MRILIIDNNIDPGSWGSPDLQRLARLAPGAEFQVRRAPEGDLPESPGPFDRIVVSGSKTSALADAPWVSRLHEFIRGAIDLGKPYLGVCYGHQSLVRAIGGKETVRKSATAELGWTKVELTEESPLTRGLPSSFYTFSSHYEEVGRLPKGMRRLAKSAACEIQACQLEGRPVYGIQFHPEKESAGAKKSFREWREKRVAPPLLHPEKSDTLYDPTVGQTLFRNFFST